MMQKNQKIFILFFKILFIFNYFLKDDPETLMKINLQRAITSKTKEVLTESQEIQVNFKTNLKDKVSRQAKYIDPSISEDQIKEICNDPEVYFI